MSHALLIFCILLLSFLGMADSWYLYQSAVTDTALSCDIGAGLDGCNIVAQSPYSYVFGVPLALYGVGFFALMFLMGAAFTFMRRRVLYQALFILSIFGSVATALFLFIQFALIRAFCVYCILSAVCTFLLFVCTRVLRKRFASLA